MALPIYPELESGVEGKESPEQAAGVQVREVLHGGGEGPLPGVLGWVLLCWVGAEVVVFSVMELRSQPQ